MVLLWNCSYRVFKKPSLKFGSSNYGFRGKGIVPGYFGSGVRKNGLFLAGGAKKGFGLHKGPGFLGGPDPSLGTMEVYHR